MFLGNDSNAVHLVEPELFLSIHRSRGYKILNHDLFLSNDLKATLSLCCEILKPGHGYIYCCDFNLNQVSDSLQRCSRSWSVARILHTVKGVYCVRQST